MTIFSIHFKRDKWRRRARVVHVEADGYFISDTDSTGYTRYTLYHKTNKGNEHVFQCNANDYEYVLMEPAS